MHWQPHKYQIDAVNFLLSHNCGALFLDPGMGKTSIVLRALQEVKKAGYKKTLIVGPLRVIHSSWPDELQGWDDFHDLKFEVFHGKNPELIRSSTADIILVNFDYIQKMAKKCKADSFIEYYGFGGVVIDELTAYKSVNSQRYKTMKQIVEKASFRWGLTGSPVANRLIDIFGQAYILDLGATFGRYITHFRNKYFRPTGYGGFKYELQNDACRDEIYKGISQLGLRLAANDYLDMPECIENKIKIQLPADAMKTYTEIEKYLVTTLNDEVMSVANKAAALNKCRQITSGSVYVNSGETEFQQIHTAKAEALKELYEELQGEQLLVYVGFRSEAAYLKSIFPSASVVIGGTSTNEFQAIKGAWDSKEVGMLIAHPQSLGHGVNLQAGGHHLCWYTLTWDYELYDQCVRRLLRQGQTSHVGVHKLLVPGTTDTYVNKVLNTKMTGQADVFAFLREEYNAHTQEA